MHPAKDNKNEDDISCTVWISQLLKQHLKSRSINQYNDQLTQHRNSTTAQTHSAAHICSQAVTSYSPHKAAKPTINSTPSSSWPLW